MKLFKEILSQIAEDTDTSLSLQYFVVDGVSGYFQNVRNIISLSGEEIVLSSLKGDIAVRGENLYIRKFTGGDMVIDGNIQAVGRTEILFKM